ncbi:uncharacterized protein LOC129585348 [Paramacrobiotus metropolitanus]|uniref:uncharacterized protein LOC129585348 n=1 Tax=Paramacrobiotus metropolitanus TaxID=2943436 RepID=UPI002446044F|nr:uncharacterized protein LOC129585348 [Paramacrobiotus metropolitanus]
MAVPTGKFVSVGQDPNGAAFFTSVGYTEQVASDINNSKNEVTLKKEGDEYVMTVAQPDLNRQQDLRFKLGQEQTQTLPSGKTVKSTTNWNDGAKTLEGRYTNSDGLTWSVNLIFKNDNEMTLKRDSPSVHNSSLEFRRA